MHKQSLLYLVSRTFLFVLFTSCHTSHDVYFLDNEAGNDSNTGQSPSHPWKSLSRLQSASLKPGTWILLKAGQTFQGTLSVKKVISEEQYPLTIGSYGNGRGILQSGDSAAVNVNDCKNVTIRNLVCIGSGRLSGNSTSGISVIGTSGLTLDSLDVSGYLFSGLEVRGGSRISITRVFAHDNGFCGIYVDANYNEQVNSVYETVHQLYIGHCVAENNPGCPVIKDNHSGNGILIGGVKGAVIEYCEAMNNGWDMPRPGNGPVGIWAYESDSVIIQHCYSHHNRTSHNGADGGGFDFDGGVTNSLLQYNLAAFNEGAGYGMFQYAGAGVWNQNIVRYNISYHDGVKNGNCGIFMWCDPVATPMKNLHAYNNTIVNDCGHGVNFLPGHYENFLFENNIFLIQNESDIFTGGKYSGAEFNQNLYWNSFHYDVNLPQPKTIPDVKPLQADPLLVLPTAESVFSIQTEELRRLPYFILKHNSTALGSGKRIVGDTIPDLWGKQKSLSQNPNIGASNQPL